MKEGMRTERVKVSAHAIVAFDLLLVVLLARSRSLAYPAISRA